MTNPTNTVYATKRLIGRAFDDPQTQKEMKVGGGGGAGRCWWQDEETCLSLMAPYHEAGYSLLLCR